MKSTAKILLSLTLALFMTGGVLNVTQGTVLAEEREKDFCYIAMDSNEGLPPDFPEGGYIYIFNPWQEEEYSVSWSGASYDVDTNTLTLNNFDHPGIGLIIDGMTKENCGSEFKIVLIGENHIQRIDDGFSGLYVKGSGSLTINENKKAQGGVVSYNKGWESEDGSIPKLHIGEDATVTIYKSPDEVTEYGDVYKSYCISISNYDKDTETAGDYLVYDGIVTPDIEWETEKEYPESYDYMYMTDMVYVKTTFNVSRLFAQEDNPDAIRLLVEGEVSDSNEVYAWLEKHNDKWYVSRSGWYDDDISGPYQETIPEDLKTGDYEITAYEVAGSAISYEIYGDSNYLYKKDGKYYVIMPEIMLVDEWAEKDASSDVFCIGEVFHDTPFTFSSGEAYDPWLLDAFSVVYGVTNGTQANKYMLDNGYEKVIARYTPASYNLRTTNESITFSPKKAETPVSDWVEEDGNWYYYDADGEVVTGWGEIGGRWYYFKETGAMVTGWNEIGGRWYYFENSGAMVTGWKQIGGRWYYFENSGSMVTGWKQLGGVWYYFANSGEMATGWKQIDGVWYYFNNGGDMVSGWKQIGGVWYYFKGGAMVTSWNQIGGVWYYFRGGAMVTGWQEIAGTWYFFEPSGAMVTGWQEIGGKWYYFYSSGAMAYSTTIDGYVLDSSGAWVH